MNIITCAMLFRGNICESVGVLSAMAGRVSCAVQHLWLGLWTMHCLMRLSSVRALRSIPGFPNAQKLRRSAFRENISTSRCRGVAFRRNLSARSSFGEEFTKENIYQEWTISEDKILWDNRGEPVSTLASLLGRGLRGTEERIAKFRDVESAAYQRLFVSGSARKITPSGEEAPKPKLIPASEVLRRIQWDQSLSTQDFSVLHYDRVGDAIVESPADAPNDSISGKATRFIDALPEHRIVAIKYKERIVWDREKRVECVFSNEGIAAVITGYDEWKSNKDDEEEQYRQRQAQVTWKIAQILGLERFAALKASLDVLTTRVKSDATVSIKREVEAFIQSAQLMFRQVRKDSSSSLIQHWIPMSDFEALDALSEFAATLADTTVRPLLLIEIAIQIKQAEGKSGGLVPQRRELPQIDENDIKETFVRGSGPGGQKVNKTSNRVFLVHEPTQLRVECQDTRSLQQNRKIARSRLREKLDEHLNGRQSKANVAAEKASSKKAKAKSRSRARQRQKQRADESSSVDADESSAPYSTAL